MKSLLLGFTAMLLAASPVFAQTTNPKPVRLERYVIRIAPIEKNNGWKWYTGTISALSDTTIAIENSRGEWFNFSYNEIERIGTRMKGSGGIGAAVGFVGGAAFGALMGSGGASSSDGINLEMEGLPIFTGGALALLGVPLGAAAGNSFKTVPINGDRELFLAFHHKLLKIKTDNLPVKKAETEVTPPVIQR